MSFPKKINLNYIDQVSYLQGFHRSGWPFVLRNLLKLQDDEGILCDTYVDRTFHWAKPSVIPYETNWIGFVHHTFDTTFSDYNNVNLLKNEDFLRSLHHCKGLFVFSTLQKKKWDNQLRKRGFVDVSVTALKHPTQTESTLFTVEKFVANESRKLVQIGAWLRDNYAIYALNNGKSKLKLKNNGDDEEEKDVLTIKKSALVGPHMQSYYKPIDFYRIFRRKQWKNSELVPPLLESPKPDTFRADEDLVPETSLSINADIPESALQEHDNEEGGGDGMCRDLMCRDSDYGLNKYVIGAISLLKKFDNSVVLIPTLENSDYDELLSKNIVFLKMVDAAAVNTILECIVRNTPIVVNRHPAIVEILGEEYPLYYDDLEKVPKILSLVSITDAYEYLQNMDKTPISINTFMEEFTSSSIYQNL